MRTLPINLNVQDRCCLVVGGGEIAAQKVSVLVPSGIAVHVVAPYVKKAIEAHDGVRVERRAFEERDLDGKLFAIAATNDPELNHRIYRLGHARGMLVNCVDDPAWCDFLYPSILRRGDLALSVSTGGSSPALARLLRQMLEEEFDEEFGATLALVQAMRREARRRCGCPGARRAANETNARMALAARAGGIGLDALRRQMEAVVCRSEGPAPVTVTIDPAPCILNPR